MNQVIISEKVMPKKIRFGKVVSTLGPASASEEAITALATSGADMFRLNFSHGSHEEHSGRIAHVRSAEEKIGNSISIVADLQGPKLRIGTFTDQNGVSLDENATFTFHLNKIPGNTDGVTLSHPEIFKAAKVGTDILVDDGRLRFRIDSVDKDTLKTTVITGGRVTQRKGVNTPGIDLPISVITKKDEEDLQYALSKNVDWIALSFVQRAEDVRQAKKMINGRAGIIAKIEKPSAVENIESIIKESDAIMVARGDLGVEIPPEEVPSTQKKIIKMCRQEGKPVIVATHMLDSMVDSPYPTRAEVSDVANAMYDGADAVMLSAETAAGKYPNESVTMMRRIVQRSVREPGFFDSVDQLSIDDGHRSEDLAVSAIHKKAEQDGAVAIIAPSVSWNLAVSHARRRSKIPLFGITADKDLARKLALVWGVVAIHVKDVSGVHEEKLADMVRERGGLDTSATITVLDSTQA